MTVVRGLVITAACGLLLVYVDWPELGRLVLRADLRWLAVVFLAVHLDRLLMAYKWSILLRSAGATRSVKDAVVAYYVSGFWGTFLPSTVGAEVVRVAWLTARTNATAAIISSVIVERVVGAAAMALFAAVALSAAALHLEASVTVFALGVGGFGLASGAAVAAVFSARVHRGVGRLGRALLPRALQHHIEGVREAVWSFKGRSSALAAFFVLSLIEQLPPILATYMLARAFAIDVSLAWVFVAVPIILALSRLPISLNAPGAQEGLYAFVFSFAGVPVSGAALISLAARLLVLLAMLPGGLCTPAVGRLQR